MGKDDESAKVVEDVEEGEISDSTSVEEVSEEDFVKLEKQQEVKVVSKSNGGWTMRDIYNYPGFRGYRSGLVNLAWAQAVQNKPLNQLLQMNDPDGKLKQSSSSPSVISSERSNAKEVDGVVIVDSGDEMDAEKEEGELEEGEIDLDSEPADGEHTAAAEEVRDGVLVCDDMDVDNSETGLKKRVRAIREALESVTVNEAEK
ncbi:RNA polymerase II C-terminal domain phosphatase-like 3 [Pyrus ussuriensis x Pyrus communis]|uniref:RNA polymerase II C-terminal domain phosphatase-like 3 n=1 Tax=Pyrus ussuriensis x Pyrus communis TaxID=2448454 RepID=A0A5N5IH66_9ROSA|nr:RNA polymerase II C-terminal domain phosphatase-like 3 [Pyrus ussuriensis x Pyrus communis]